MPSIQVTRHPKARQVGSLQHYLLPGPQWEPRLQPRALLPHRLPRPPRWGLRTLLVSGPHVVWTPDRLQDSPHQGIDGKINHQHHWYEWHQRYQDYQPAEVDTDYRQDQEDRFSNTHKTWALRVRGKIEDLPALGDPQLVRNPVHE